MANPVAPGRFNSANYPLDCNKRSRRNQKLLPRRDPYNLRSRGATSVGPSDAETRYNRDCLSGTPDLGSRLDIRVSEERAFAAPTKLQKLVNYDRKWRQIRDPGNELIFTFKNFPWPIFEDVTKSTFLEKVNRDAINKFVFDPLRMCAREVDERTLRNHEMINWAKDRTLQSKIVSWDLDLVTEAYAIVSFYLNDDTDENKLSNHRDRFEKHSDPYASAILTAEISSWDVHPYFDSDVTSNLPLTPRIGSPEPDFSHDALRRYDSLFSQETDTSSPAPPRNDEEPFEINYRAFQEFQLLQASTVQTNEDTDEEDMDIV